MALAWLLENVTLTEPALPKVVQPNSSDLEPVQKQADDLARYAAGWNPNLDATMSILRALSATDSEFVVANQRPVEILFFRAKRLLLALDRLTNAVNANRGAPLKIDYELNSLRDDVRLRESFEPAHFVEHLRAFRSALTK